MVSESDEMRWGLASDHQLLRSVHRTLGLHTWALKSPRSYNKGRWKHISRFVSWHVAIFTIRVVTAATAATAAQSNHEWTLKGTVDAELQF